MKWGSLQLGESIKKSEILFNFNNQIYVCPWINSIAEILFSSYKVTCL